MVWPSDSSAPSMNPIVRQPLQYASYVFTEISKSFAVYTSEFQLKFWLKFERLWLKRLTRELDAGQDCRHHVGLEYKDYRHHHKDEIFFCGSHNVSYFLFILCVM